MPEGERRIFRATLADLSTEAPRFSWEVRLLTQNGSLFHADTSVAMVPGSQGQPIALRWLIRDVTHQKQREAVQTARLIELERELGST